MKNLLVYLAILGSSNTFADIFGEDNRREVRRGGKESLLARAVAVGVINSLWTEVGTNFFDLWADPITGMCKDEPFINQLSVSYACTGFLVGPDLLVTAGHCGVNVGEVRNSSADYCEAYTWMFDYYHTTNVKRIPRDNVYKCKEIIYATQVGEGIGQQDFTLLRLDRVVKNRKPLKLAQSTPSLNEKVFMLGHPMGLPMKMTDNAEVFRTVEGHSFLTNLDAFSGNSGSPVLNERDEVVGVLVAGNPAISTYRDEVSGCDRYNRCDENGENCTDINISEEDQGFPNTYSEVQDIQFYRDLIESEGI